MVVKLRDTKPKRGAKVGGNLIVDYPTRHCKV